MTDLKVIQGKIPTAAWTLDASVGSEGRKARLNGHELFAVRHGVKWDWWVTSDPAREYIVARGTKDAVEDAKLEAERTAQNMAPGMLSTESHLPSILYAAKSGAWNV